ncbi:lipoprotein [Actinoplanes sp. NPDC051346]|uniref:lipoprotein n=1 Tax=Actinoplanes sp. NPDC051346 TaxID=3155048 RepID=UPI00342F5C06
MKITMMHGRRRGVAAAAAAMSVLLLSACKSTETTPAGAPASSSASATADRTRECTTATDSFRKLIADLLMAGAGAEDDKEHTAARKALTDYASTARGEAAKVTDPALRAGVEQLAAAAEKLSKAADPTNLDNPDMKKAAGEIEKVCADALTPSAPPGTPTVRLGAAGSPCELPVSFDLVALWKPKAVDVAQLGELASLYRNGPFEAVCEVDPKPAGELGMMRVFTSKTAAGSPRASLEAFVAGDSLEARKAGNYEVKKIKYTELTLGGQPAAEVTWEPYNKALDHASKYSAFALNTARGAVVVKISPFGADEHVNLLPAYELAKKSLTVNS